MQIALRVDASVDIGLGHVHRCLALAHALADAGGEVIFVTRNFGVDARQRIERAGFDVQQLSSVRGSPMVDTTPLHPDPVWAGVPWPTDAEQTCHALRDRRPDWLVVDHYAFDARWHAQVAQALQCRVAVIDDLADRPLECDLLIDHNLADDHRRKYAGRLPESATLLGGPRFALLGPSYVSASRYTPNDTVRSIGIFMGGSDPAGLSELALRGCREVAGFNGPIEIATTSANPQLATLGFLVESCNATRLSIDLLDLAGFFARHDLQIGAGGGASWERCCIGSPTLSVVAATNQRNVVDGLVAHGAAATLPPGVLPNAQTIGRAVTALLEAPQRRLQLAKRARTLVDGIGATRVALHLLGSTLTLRPARTDDAELIYRWRNHPSTRAVSRNTEPIAADTHRVWISQVLDDPRRHLFIGIVGRRPVGVIRLDDDEIALRTEVSLFLDPALHGLSLGRFLLRAGENACRAKAQSWLLVATVSDRNPASRRLFATAGYHFEGERGEKPLRAALSSEDCAS